ncbi:MAG: autotransporter domain-containing protein [Candidatus Berkiellales bacterium]
MKKTPIRPASLLAQAVLASAALASTVFCAFPQTANAVLTQLNLAANGQNSGNATYPPTNGYQYTDSVTFTILDLTNVGNTGGVSFTSGLLAPTLDFAGTSVVSGTVTDITTINIQGAPSSTVTFDSTVNSTGGNDNLNITANGTVSVVSGSNLNSINVDNTSGIPSQGTLQLQGTNSVTGNIGFTQPLNLITLNSAGIASAIDTFATGSFVVNATTITVNDDKSGNPATGTTLSLNGPMALTASNITVTTNNEDTLQLNNGPLQVNANIGAIGSGFNLITIGAGDFAINGNIFATLTKFTVAGATLTLGNNPTITGNIDSTAAGQGTLIFPGNGIVTGTVGTTNALNEIDIEGGAGTNVNFQSSVKVQPGNINFNGAASPTTGITFNDGVIITANIDSPLAAGNGELFFLGGANVNGTIGVITHPINAIFLEGPTSTVNFSTNIGANSLFFALGATPLTTASFADGAVINSSVDNLTGNSLNGLLQFQGGGEITGNIGTLDGIGKIIVDNSGLNNKTLILDGTLIKVNNIITKTTTDILNLTGLAGPAIVNANIGDNVHSFSFLNVAANGNITINGNIFAANTQFQANNSLTLGDGDNVTGTITALAPGNGTLIFAGGGSVTGNIGPLAQINLTGVGGKNVTLSGTINPGAGNLNFAPGSTPLSLLTFGDGSVINGNIDNTTGKSDIGIINFLGGGTVNGTIGATKSVHAINLFGAGKNVNLNGNVMLGSGDINFGPGTTPSSKLTLGNNVVVTGGIDNISGVSNSGTLVFTGSGQVTGDIGDTQPLFQITVNSGGGTNTAELDGNKVNAQTIVLNDDGINTTTLLLNNPDMALTADITAKTANIDILNIQQAASLAGNIGVGARLKEIDVAEFGNTLITGNTGPGNIVATTLLFKGNNTLTLGDKETVTGNIASNGVGGILQFQGDGTVTGTIGALGNALSLIKLEGASTTVNFNNNIFVGSLNFIAGANGDTTANLLKGVVLTGSVDNLVGKNVGVLQFSGDGKVTGNIGATNPLNLIALNTGNFLNSTIELDGSIINANKINVVGTGGTTLKLNNGSPMVLTSNISTKNNGIDTVETTNALVTINGNLGSATHTFKIFKIGANTNMNGDIFAANTQFQANKTLTMGNNAIIHGPVTTTANNQGILAFNGNSVINFPVGAAGKSLVGVNIDGPPNSIVTLNNNIFAANTQVNNGGTLFITGKQTITGNVNVNKGVLSLAPSAAPVTVDGIFNLNNGTALGIDFNHTLSTGNLVATGTANVFPGAKVIITNAPLAVADGITPHTIVTGSAGSNLNAIPVFSNTLLLDFFTQVNNTNHTLNLFIDAIPVTTFANQSNTKGVAGALDSIINTSMLGMSTVPGLLGEIVDQLDSFTSVESLNQALAELAPTVDGAVLKETFNIQLETFDVIALRLNAILHGKIRQLGLTRQNGYNAGDDRDDIGRGAWAKFFGQYSHQKTRDNILGYHDDVWGIAAGYDWMFTDYILAGVALSWGEADVDNMISKGSQTDIDSYQAALYGQYVFECPYYLNWFLAVGYNGYDAVRNVTFGELFFIPEAVYHAWQYSAKAEMGYVFGQEGPYHTVPVASLYYSLLDFESYTETGAGTANQTVHPDDANMLLGGLGVRFIYDYYHKQTLVQPELHVMGYYDFINDQMQTQSQFIGAGPNFITSGANPVADSYVIGASISTFSEEGLVVTLNYDYNFKQDYRAHAGFIRARYEW